MSDASRNHPDGDSETLASQVGDQLRRDIFSASRRLKQYRQVLRGRVR
jgi:hypothetical protein